MKKNLFILTLIMSIFVTNALSQSNPEVRAQFLSCSDPSIGCQNPAINRVRMDANKEYVHGVDGVSAVFNIGSGSMDLTINLIK